MFKILSNSTLTNILSFGFLTIALILVFFPEFSSVEGISYYTLHFMMGFLVIAMIFLLLGRKRLMFACLISSGILAMFLKNASYQHIVLPKTNNLPALNIAHFNLSNVQNNRDSLYNMIQDLDPDILSLQEFTPDWNRFFEGKNMERYDYFSKDVRIDPYGVCIFSKYPIKNANLYYHNDIPNYKSHIQLAEITIALYTSYLLPPFSPSGKVDTKTHLDKIATRVTDSPYPKIVMGDFNMVYWANELRRFRADAELSNSRREVNVSGLKKIPYDHIFFSQDLECTNYIDLLDPNDNHIGIYGSYQLKDEELMDLGTSTLSNSY